MARKHRNGILVRWSPGAGEGFIDLDKVVWIEKVDKGHYEVCYNDGRRSSVYGSEREAKWSAAERFKTLIAWEVMQ